MESGSENMDLLPELGDDVDDVVELEDDAEAPPVVPPVGSGSGSGSATATASASIGSTLSRRKLVSDVWSHFNMLPLQPGKKQRCQCNKCGTTYACPSTFGTGNLRKHIEKCVRRDTIDVGQLLITRETPSLNLTQPKFSQQKYRELFVAAIIMHEEPFQFVEYEGFRALHHYLNNKVQTISRNTCKADVIKSYAREKERIKSMLQSAPGRICFTSDLWTSIVTDGYLSLTAHFIDNDWNLQKRILNFSIIPPPHTGVNLCEKIYSLFLDWGIEKKFFSMTLDNASSNACFINLLFDEYSSNAVTSDHTLLTKKQSRADILYANEGQDVFKELDAYENEESVQFAKKTQLELYLEEPKIDRKTNLNILDFWKGNQFRYPELAAMSRDILSIPISTVASESVFSAAGRILDQYRSSLLPDTAEAIVCSRDWLYGEKAAAKLRLDEATEDIMNIDINKDESDTA